MGLSSKTFRISTPLSQMFVQLNRKHVRHMSRVWHTNRLTMRESDRAAHEANRDGDVETGDQNHCSDGSALLPRPEVETLIQCSLPGRYRANMA